MFKKRKQSKLQAAVDAYADASNTYRALQKKLAECTATMSANRDIIAKAFHDTPDSVILYTSSGATAGLRVVVSPLRTKTNERIIHTATVQP
jgi:hypothetical protein